MERKKASNQGSKTSACELSSVRLGEVAGGAFVNSTKNTDESINNSFNDNNSTSFVVSGDNNTQTIGGSVNFSGKGTSDGGKAVDLSKISPFLKIFNDGCVTDTEDYCVHNGSYLQFNVFNS